MSGLNSVKARIVLPTPSTSCGLVKTQGTKVMIGDLPLPGVTKITLHGEANDIWRATIECNLQPPSELVALSVVKVRKDPWWRRILRRMRRGGLEVTNIDSTIREYRR
jgi:hypothetical protein